MDRLQIALEDNDRATRSTIAELTSARAWEYAVERLGQREREALNSYALAVRQLGKGTGKYAPHRRAHSSFSTSS